MHSECQSQVISSSADPVRIKVRACAVGRCRMSTNHTSMEELTFSSHIKSYFVGDWQLLERYVAVYIYYINGRWMCHICFCNFCLSFVWASLHEKYVNSVIPIGEVFIQWSLYIRPSWIFLILPMVARKPWLCCTDKLWYG